MLKKSAVVALLPAVMVVGGVGAAHASTADGPRTAAVTRAEPAAHIDRTARPADRNRDRPGHSNNNRSGNQGSSRTDVSAEQTDTASEVRQRNLERQRDAAEARQRARERDRDRGLPVVGGLLDR